MYHNTANENGISKEASDRSKNWILSKPRRFDFCVDRRDRNVAMSRCVSSKRAEKAGGPKRGDVVNEKATTYVAAVHPRRGGKKRRTVAAAEDDVWPRTLEGREQNGDRSCCRVPVATRLRCIVLNSQREFFSAIALNNVCVIEARGSRSYEIFFFLSRMAKGRSFCDQ